MGDDAEFYIEMQEEEQKYRQIPANDYYSDANVFNTLYLVDGDNHIHEGLEGMDNISAFGRIIVFVSQESLRSKLKKRYGNKIEIIMVKPGENAVDNKIKSILGNKLKQREGYQKIHVISHDQGYRDLINIKENIIYLPSIYL